MYIQQRLAGVALLAMVLAPTTAAPSPAEPTCKSVQADLVEDRSTTSCKPGHTSCFTGSVDGNHGLRGTTYFNADSGALGPGTSPGWRSYSGVFEYTTDRGTLVLRETGAVNVTQGNPESGATTAFQKVVSGTGEFSGSTGHLFVNGFNINNHVVTKVSGETCTP